MRMTLYAAVLALLGTVAGCQQLPGTEEQQTTAAGTAAGAAVGALLADEDNQLMGALLGGALGAGGGYLLGAKTDVFEQGQADKSAQAEQAIEEARQDPATVDEALAANTADLDGNGFVTTDELIAMEEAGLSDDQILSRLRATDAVFDLSQEQADQLITAGVSPEVVNQLETINREERDQIIGRLEQ
jgi:hypothetical protein